MNCRFKFSGGSLNGTCAAGEEAARLYLSTSKGTLGEQIRALSADCKKSIQARGFVSVHRSGEIEREVYEVVDHRAKGEEIVVACMFIGIERS